MTHRLKVRERETAEISARRLRSKAKSGKRRRAKEVSCRGLADEVLAERKLSFLRDRYSVTET